MAKTQVCLPKKTRTEYWILGVSLTAAIITIFAFISKGGVLASGAQVGLENELQGQPLSTPIVLAVLIIIMVVYYWRRK